MKMVRDIMEAMEQGFDTKVRRAIESAADQLHALAKDDSDEARKREDDVIIGLQRLVKSDPIKFMYSTLEILGVRGKYKSARYGRTSDK